MSEHVILDPGPGGARVSLPCKHCGANERHRAMRHTDGGWEHADPKSCVAVLTTERDTLLSPPPTEAT